MVITHGAISAVECCCSLVIVTSTYVAELIIDYAATGVGVREEA